MGVIIRKEVLELLQGKQDGQDLECACHIYYHYVPGRTHIVLSLLHAKMSIISE